MVEDDTENQQIFIEVIASLKDRNNHIYECHEFARNFTYTTSYAKRILSRRLQPKLN